MLIVQNGTKAYHYAAEREPRILHIPFALRADQRKPQSAQQARHKRIRFAYGAASAPLRPASQVL